MTGRTWSFTKLYKRTLERHPPAAWLVLLLSLVVTGWAWFISERAVNQTITDRFSFQAQDLSTAITNRMRQYELALRSGAALFDASDSVSRQDWSDFADTIYLQKHFPGIQALGYSVVLSPQELEKHIAAVRSEGFPTFTVTPEGPRDRYTAITFIEPFDWRNQRAFGYDMLSEETRREAMDRARDRGQPALSGRVTLVQETDEDVQYGFLMYYPVYKKGMPVDYVDERRAALKSYVYAAFRMNDLMAGILGQSQSELGFEIFDGQQIATDKLLYTSEDRPLNALTSHEGEQLIHNDTLEIAGRSWTLHVYSKTGFVPFNERHQPEFIVVTGVLLDIFLFYLISYLVRVRNQATVSAISAEAARNVTEQRMLLAAEAANMGLAEWNIADNTLIWDERMLALYGYSASSFSGKLDDWESRLHPDDKQRVLDTIDHAKKFSNRFEMAFRIVLPNDEVRYIVASVIVERDQSDNPIRMVGFNYDVTEKREAEQALTQKNWQLQSVVEATNAGTWEWHIDSGKVTLNDRWAEIVGYQLEELQPTTYETMTQFFHPDDYITREEILQNHLQKKTDHYSMQVRLRHRDGNWVWAISRGKVFAWDAQGKPSIVIGTLIDISGQKRVEALLEKERDRAELANRSRGEFLANMSHEIRTPINGVIGALNLLSDTPLSATQHNLIQISKHSADALLGLINDILDLSKMESGKLHIHEEETELARLVGEASLALASKAEAKGLTLLCPSHYLEPLTVMVDGLRLRQVLTNLLSNAIKYTDSGQVTLDVMMLGESSGQIDLRFEIRDTGAGITKEKQSRLFQRFEQLDNSLTRREGGTGLGLAICKQLIDMMGGRIGVETEEGKGSNFWFELRLDRAGPRHIIKEPPFRDMSLVAAGASALYSAFYQSIFDAWGVAYQRIDDLNLATVQLAAEPSKQKVLLMDSMLFEKPSLIEAWIESHSGYLDNIHIIVTCPLSMLAIVPQSISDMADLILSKPLIQSELYKALQTVVSDDVSDSTSTGVQKSPMASFDARVLIVEDNLTNIAIVTGLLHKFGVRTGLAENGQQALELLANEPFDLVLMDCQMPIMDGFETTQRIREDGKVLNASIPIIALTAFAMDEDEHKCLSAGMNDYIAKPIDPTLLNKKLVRWLPQHCLKNIAETG